MAWSIAEVARMSNVTSRTLRHYDDIGLLTPAYVGSNGYRYYEQEKQDFLNAQQQGEQEADLVLMDEHYTSVAKFWTPDRESYTGLGQLYVDHPEFRARYDALAPGLAEYLRDATAAYATQRLH